MSQTSGLSSPGQRQSDWPNAQRFSAAVWSIAPAVLFGLRLWIAACLAIYIAFALELDNAFWAGTSAAFVCQPTVGASLRKGWFYIIGSVVGAVAILVLSACFPQDRVAFLLGLALWGATCAFVSTLLHNFAGFSAALAAITAAIIGSNELGSVGGANGQVFWLAVTRVSEISIGIVCAGVVLAGTDLGGAPRRLAARLTALATEIMAGFTGTLSRAGRDPTDTRSIRREFIRRVVALDPAIDETIGESSRLRFQSPVLRTAVDGLIAAIAGWRTVADHILLMPPNQASAEAAAVLRGLPRQPRPVSAPGEPGLEIAEPARLGLLYQEAAIALVGQKTSTPSPRLIVDHSAEVLVGISHVLDGLALLADDPARPLRARGGMVRLRVPDWLPALVNAGRAFVTIGAVALFWIVTAWPNGATAMIFVTIGVVLLATRGDQAYTAALSFTLGTFLAAALAATIKFAVLPKIDGFPGFCMAIGLVLVPAASLMTLPRQPAKGWQTALFTATTLFFFPLLAPSNQMVYDTQQFYNADSAIVAGFGAAAFAFRMLPPLAPALRTRRLLALTLRDLRRLAVRSKIPATGDWRSRVYDRISVLPEQAEPVQRAHMVAALVVGSEIIQLRRIAPGFGLSSGLGTTLQAVAQGNVAGAIAGLTGLDRAFASDSVAGSAASIAIRARGSILAMSEALNDHAVYFGAGASR
jgi:uncharacterized membrane protein YccC